MSQNGSATRPASGASPDPYPHVAVIGGGAWGTALALISDAAGRRTSLWIRETDVAAAIRRDGATPFLPGHAIPRSIEASEEIATAVAGAGLALLVVPSQFLRAVATQVEARLAPGVPVVICSKGIEADTGALMTQVVGEAMPGRPQAVMSGPSFADEAAAGQPTAVTVAVDPAQGHDLTDPGNLAARIAVTLGAGNLRPYLSDDPVGVEVGGAVKNVIAIACGIAAGKGLGSNARAALITRGLAEIKRLALALGGQAETVTGLAGIGDLTLTCSSEQSRNFTFGKALGAGASAEQALAGKAAVVEGAVNARAVVALAGKLGVEMPICRTVDAIVHRGLSVDEAIGELLSRPLRAEPRTLEGEVLVPHPGGSGIEPETKPA